MTPLDRKIALMRAGVTAADIASELGVTRQFVSEVVRGTRRSDGDRVEAAIAAAIGKPVADVFAPRDAKAA